MSTCERLDEVRDFAFDEVPASARASVKKHIAGCDECAAELDRLQLTTAALRILPDREVPQRIAFVSDKVFEPSAMSRWFGGLWNSAARLGFASAAMLAVALIVSAYHHPAPGPAPAVGAATATQVVAANAAMQSPDVSQQVNEAVARAVAQVRAEDSAMSAQITRAALEEQDRKHEQEHRALQVAMEENMTLLQKRFDTYRLTMLASADAPRYGAGQ
jgi:hypothetical protein